MCPPAVASSSASLVPLLLPFDPGGNLWASGLLWAAGAFLAAWTVDGIISVPLICWLVVAVREFLRAASLLSGVSSAWAAQGGRLECARGGEGARVLIGATADWVISLTPGQTSRRYFFPFPPLHLVCALSPCRRQLRPLSGVREKPRGWGGRAPTSSRHLCGGLSSSVAAVAVVRATLEAW